jgi:hypothetical protein
MYAKVLYAHFGFHLTFIYIEEEVWSELGKVDKSILQLSFRDNEGQRWLLPPMHYRAFGLNTALMAVSTDLVSQPLDMFSVQPSLLHSMKLESPDNLVHLFRNSSRPELSNVSLPIPVADTHVSDSKCSSPSPSLFLLVYLVTPTSLTPCSTPILESIPVSCSALDTWP